MAAGSIIVDLLMRTGLFETDTKRAGKALKELERDAIKVGKAIGVAVVAGATALLYLGQRSISAADDMSKAAQSAGVTTEELSALAYAADLAGISKEELSKSLVKLTKNMSDTAQGTGDAADGFAAMGISVTDSNGRLKSSTQVLGEVADKFATYGESAERTALAVKIFGKSGAELIPLLLGGSEGIAKLTEEAERLGLVIGTKTGKEAEAFNDNMNKLGKAINGVFNRIMADLLPSLVDLSGGFVDLAKDEQAMSAVTDLVRAGFDAMITVFKTLTPIVTDMAFEFVFLGKKLGALAAQAVALAHFDMPAVRAISEAFDEDIKLARGKLDKFQAHVAGLGDPRSASVNDRSNARLKRQGGGPQPLGNAPRISNGAAGKASNSKAFEIELKSIEAFAKQQRAGYDFANAYVQGAYDAGLIGLEDFLNTEKRLREAALEATTTALDKEIELATRHSKKLSGADRIAADGKIAESVAKRAEAVQKASQDEILAAQATTKALEQVAQRYNDFRAQLFSLSGDDKAAFGIRLAQQVEEAKRTVTSAGGDQSLVGQFEAKLQATEQLRVAQEEYNTLLRKASNAEEELLLTARNSGESEMDTLRKVAAVRAESLVQLDALVKKAQELARALGSKEAVLFADDLGMAFKRAVVEVDPALEKIRDLGRSAGDIIANGLTNAATSGKKLRATLGGIFDDLFRLVAHEAFTKPLSMQIASSINNTGGSSSGGGIGGFFGGILGKVFGGFGKAAAPAAMPIPWDLGFANGGDPPVGVPSMVGERGPELFVPRTAGTIIPNHKLGGNKTVNLTSVTNFTLNQPMDRRTQRQAAAVVYGAGVDAVSRIA